MNVAKCSACGQPIVGYWVAIKKMGDNRNFCVPCAQSTTVWDLVVDGVFGIHPDIAVEVDEGKQILSSAYGMVAGENNTVADTDSSHGKVDVKSSYPADYVKKIAANKEALNKEVGLKLDPDKNLPENVEFMETEDNA